MGKLHFVKLSAVALSLSLCLVTVPVLAHQGRAVAETETETTTVNTDGSSDTELHKRGQAMAEKMRAQHQEDKATRTDAQKQKTCEAHKQGLTKKFERITANSEKIKKHIDEVFTKAQAYQQANNLPVSNYNELVTAATTAQTAAEESIATLKTVKPTVDCNNTSVANDVATFKAAAQDTRDKLKAYRTSVKDILQALHKAKTSSESSEGSNE